MYQALYRKWRPRTFDDVVGQEHITETLKRQVAAGRLSHAYLFTGTRGTGKTTCAKILARAVNCQRPENGNPCNGCAACRGIENGSVLDVVELDAASNNRVDDIRAILDEAAYTPASVSKRVYIVDEVHMLSGQAFNALLQILEEPPEHLMFILATTEIHKVPATIKSRCQQFSFKRIRAGDIAARLSYVARQEGLELSDEGAALLARLADGGMRDALSLLDQCAGERRSIGEAEVLETLGLAGNLEAAALLESVARGDTDGALSRLDRLYAGGKEMAALLGELSALVRDLLIGRTAPRSGASLMTGGFDGAALKRLGALLDTPRLVQMLGVLQRTAAELTRSPNRRTDTELCLVTLCDPRLDGSAAGLAARIAALEEQIKAGGVRIVGAAEEKASAVKEKSLPPEKRPPLEEPPEERPPLDEPPPEGPTFDDDPPPWAWEEKPTALKGGAADEHSSEQPHRADRAEGASSPPAEPRPGTGAGEGLGPPAPREPRPAPPAAGVSWAALRARLEPVMDVADFCFVGNPDMVTGSIAGDLVTLWVETDFVKGFIDSPAILELVGKTAEQLTGRPCRAAVRVGQAPPEGPQSPPPADSLDALLGLDNVTMT